jgi:sporulation protein YlmC with PRC-barrel domain
MLVSELLRCSVVTRSGEKLGHVFDLRVARSPRSDRKRADQEWRLVGLVVGPRGARERFGLVRGGLAGPRHERDAIPWDSVVRMRPGEIVVRDGTEPR